MAVKTTMLDYAYFEGNVVPFGEATISIGTHAIQYGTGAFAGIRGYVDQDGETINIFRLIDHTTRLLNSGKLLRSELDYTPESLAEVIANLVAKNA
ncbi:MAG TPA: branched chain amino acid aminotransferase, partial [Thermomicrobiales bacterium]|nr:branched chain amino acid aminotransferase [Thermomicrobiales bacterium]